MNPPTAPMPTLSASLLPALTLLARQLQEIARLQLRVADLEDQVAGARANCEAEQQEHQRYRAAHPARDRQRPRPVRDVDGGAL